MKLTGENRSATSSTTNPTWTDQGSNPGLRGRRPATNRLSMARPTSELTEEWWKAAYILQIRTRRLRLDQLQPLVI
jgi:hypothetical protein